MNQPLWAKKEMEKRMANVPYGFSTTTEKGKKVNPKKPTMADLLVLHEGEYVLNNPTVNALGGEEGIKSMLKRELVRKNNRMPNIINMQSGGMVNSMINVGEASPQEKELSKVVYPQSRKRMPKIINMQEGGMITGDTGATLFKTKSPYESAIEAMDKYNQKVKKVSPSAPPVTGAPVTPLSQTITPTAEVKQPVAPPVVGAPTSGAVQQAPVVAQQTVPSTPPPAKMSTMVTEAPPKKPLAKPLVPGEKDIQRTIQTQRDIASGKSPLLQNIANRAMTDTDIKNALAQSSLYARMANTPNLTTGAKNTLAAEAAATAAGQRAGLEGQLAQQALTAMQSANVELYNMGVGERAHYDAQTNADFDVQMQSLDRLLDDAAKTGNYDLAKQQYDAMKSNPDFARLMPATDYDWEGIKKSGVAARNAVRTNEISKNIGSVSNTPEGRDASYSMNKPYLLDMLKDEDPNWDSLPDDEKERRAKARNDMYFETANLSPDQKAIQSLMNNDAYRKYFDTSLEYDTLSKAITDNIADFIKTDDAGNITANVTAINDLIKDPKYSYVFSRTPKKDTNGNIIPNQYDYSGGWNDNTFAAREKFNDKYKDEKYLLDDDKFQEIVDKGIKEGKIPEDIIKSLDDAQFSYVKEKEDAYKDPETGKDYTELSKLGEIFLKENSLGDYDQALSQDPNMTIGKLFEEWRSQNPNINLKSSDAKKSFSDYETNYKKPIISTHPGEGTVFMTNGQYMEAGGRSFKMSENDRFEVPENTMISLDWNAFKERGEGLTVPRGTYVYKTITVLENGKPRDVKVLQNVKNANEKYYVGEKAGTNLAKGLSDLGIKYYGGAQTSSSGKEPTVGMKTAYRIAS